MDNIALTLSTSGLKISPCLLGECNWTRGQAVHYGEGGGLKNWKIGVPLCI